VEWPSSCLQVSCAIRRVASLHEHGTDSGCGDNNWPKTFVYLAGWGFGHATLNGKPLYQDYEMHFMVTQGIRDRKTLKVNYPVPNKKGPAGEVNPATQQLDFYIRSPKQDPQHTEPRGVRALFCDGSDLEVENRWVCRHPQFGRQECLQDHTPRLGLLDARKARGPVTTGCL
jgi:hypothetical protein